MKILTILLFAACTCGAARGFSQSISLSVKNAPLEKIFQEIQRQSGYRFVYTKEQLENTVPVTVHVSNGELNTILAICFNSQPLSYSIENKYILVKSVPLKNKAKELPLTISGKVVSEESFPLAGVTVQIKGSDVKIITDAAGEFILKDIAAGSILLFSGAEVESKEITVSTERRFQIILAQKINSLNESIVIAYGKTTRRLNTGSVGKVSAAEISRQPVSNPLAALQGRVAGLNIRQVNGLPGSNFVVQIRGRASIKQGTQPLYVIDGVPFSFNTQSLAQVSPSISSNSNNPLNAINPSDIESIEVLKDADATAIYGSQGANGVIMITTKKGAIGKTKLDINIYTGTGRVTRTLPMLNTAQYIAMRKEAFANDGLAPTVSTAPDLLSWDTTKYTDWEKMLIGGTARTVNLQAGLSGGNASTQFLINSGYFSETTVFPGSKPASKANLRFNLSHSSLSKKFKIDLTGAYANESRNLPASDLTSFINLSPNAPDMLDASGNLTWANGVDNPMSFLYRTYEVISGTLLSNINMLYQLPKGFSFRVNAGYTIVQTDEKASMPIKSQRPAAGITGTAQIGSAGMKSWIAEPQLLYQTKLPSFTVDLVTGISWQERKQHGHTINGSQFTSDELLGTMTSAGLITVSNYESRYNYNGAFARATLNRKNKYVLNLNFRRDGSSRFGPSERFSNFGAVGAAWIFSEEPFIKNKHSLISFGKIRSSYGVTGNDQIGDYLYLDAWTSQSVYQYQGSSGILPNRLFNPYFQWEKNKKLEAAIDLGFLNNRLQLSVSYHRNRSSNQLVTYRLPSQVGIISILKNLDALVQNSGVEVELTAKILQLKKFSWRTSMNLSIPDNKLITYPGLETSSDKLTYATGQPLDAVFGYQYTGIHPTTGVYTFKDIDGNGLISSPNDLMYVGYTGIHFQGGLSNDISYKGFELNIFFQFVKQTGNNYLINQSTRPGFLGNQPTFVLNRWQKPGDNALIQRFTSSATAASTAYALLRTSSGLQQDASYIRLKNLSASYRLAANWLRGSGIESLQLYMEGQNLLTITGYKGSDPETQNLFTLPPLKIFVAGIRLIL